MIATGALLVPTMTARAQFMADMMVASAVSNDLASSSVSSGTGALGLGRARDVAAKANTYADQFKMYSAAGAGQMQGMEGGSLGMAGQVEGGMAGVGMPGMPGMPGMGGGMGMMGAGAGQQMPQMTEVQSYFQAMNGLNNTAMSVLLQIQARDKVNDFIPVMTGERVMCAVTGAMLDDVSVTLLPVEKDKKDESIKKFIDDSGIQIVDDGIHDNGIEGDGIYGQVTVSSGNVISPEANRLRSTLMRVLHQAEFLAPSSVVDYKSLNAGGQAAVNLHRTGIVVDDQSGQQANYSQATQSLMRFFLLHVVAEGMSEPNPAPMPGTVGKTLHAVTVLEKQRQRDDYLREWELRFLAPYRVTPEDPRSDFYPVYVPSAPTVPEIDRAYVAGAIKLSAVTGQQFPIYAMRPEVDKAFVSDRMKETLAEFVPSEFPDPAAERIRVPAPAGYRAPQERNQGAQVDANGNPLAGGAVGGAGGAMPGMPGPGGGGGGAMP